MNEQPTIEVPCPNCGITTRLDQDYVLQVEIARQETPPRNDIGGFRCLVCGAEIFIKNVVRAELPLVEMTTKEDGDIYLEAMYQGALDYPALKDEDTIRAKARTYFQSPGHVGTGTAEEIKVYAEGYGNYVAPNRNDEATGDASAMIKAMAKPVAIAVMRAMLPEHLGGGH